MRKLHQLFRFPLLLGWMLLTLGVWMSIQHPVAHAAASFPSGYSLALTESTSTMTYGGPAPNFQAQLTVPTGEHPLTSPNQFSFTVDAQNANNARTYAPDASGGSGSSYTFSLSGASVAARFMPLSGGPHTMVANYFSSVLGQTLQSAPVTFTVQPLTPTISCSIDVHLFAANAVLFFTLSMQNGPYIDWANATYGITFLGPQTFTESNLTAVPSLTSQTTAQVRTSAPPMPGSYRYQCTFNGTSNFSAVQTAVSTDTLIVSQGHQPTIKLYSNPTTIPVGQTATLYVVISGRPGLPTPTGQILFNLPGGVYRTNLISLGSDGSVTVQLIFPSGPPSVTTFSVIYSGDAIYAVTTTDFPFTNPPIPGGGTQPTPVSTSTTAAGSTPSSGSTPVPSSSATPGGGSTPAASSTTGANGGTTTGSHPTDTTSKQGTLAFWIVLVVLLLLAAGGSGAFIVLRKRPRVAATSATVTLPSSEEG